MFFAVSVAYYYSTCVNTLVVEGMHLSDIDMGCTTVAMKLMTYCDCGACTPHCTLHQ